MPPSNTQTGCQPGGFTLVEVVLVVALLALLVTLAAPSYQAFLLRAHRSDAMAQLMDVAACQERTRAGSGAYDTTGCLPPPSARYVFYYLSDTAPMAPYYRAAARPRGAQAADPCGELQLDSLGSRAVSSRDASASHCWAGR
jgi:type IV pilus assembly protein PilE